MRTTALCTLALIALVGCASGPKALSPEELAATARADAAAEVASLLTGTFSSAAQSFGSPDDYLDIHVGAALIWPERTDGPWIYLEQAASAALARPYRQRVYRIVAESADVVVSQIHELPGDLKMIVGAHRDPSLLVGIAPEGLAYLDGCDVKLVRSGESTWSGGTASDGCPTDWNGAHHATSEVTVNPDQLKSWDRGFAEDGEFLWGPEKGAYVFDRID